MAAALTACAPQYGVEVTQEGTSISLFVEGQTEGNGAWLCPSDPGPGETLGAIGAARLEAEGCIDLGPGTVDESMGGWGTTFDVRDLPAEKLAAFRPGATYRLLLNHYSAASGGTYSTDLPPITLVP